MVMMMMMMMIMIMKMTKIQDNLPRRRKTLPASKSQFNTNHDYFCDENKGLLMMEQKMFRGDLQPSTQDIRPPQNLPYIIIIMMTMMAMVTMVKDKGF